ncbi:MAG: phenylalanine--tRNA ligase subunit beta [Ignavibacteriales bacterium]|nr:phenylalanine--tRNA ligase subunit beta [Ignavibacteriales bacterium]
MKISLNWLKQYINLDGVGTDYLANLLTMAGLEVEDIEDKAKKLNGFVVGHVIEKEKHPNADKLSVCKIFDGTETRQVVCGAPNIAAGQKIIIALPGAVVPSNGMEIGKAKLRGVESHGMVCSERELELSEDHSGIMVLHEDSVPGTAAADYLGLNDIHFEIGITPNRPDALSHIGVARDIAALLDKELLLPELRSTNNGAGEVANYASISIEDFTNCPRYSATIVKNVVVKESPVWLKRRIESIGLRAINNVVDITNFILNEIGQPLHAFDLDKLAVKKIVVRNAGKETDFTTLDSKVRKLNENTLLICDGEKAVAIAGVMGGENSEVTAETKNVLIESAFFNAGSIRKTSKLLGLSTDASYRFERGTDPGITLFAAQRAAELIAEVCGGEVVSGYFDVKQDEVVKKTVTVNPEKVNSILGYFISTKKMLSIVKRLGFVVISQDDKLVLEIPTFRPDVEREIDVVEEIARIYGYDEIPAVASVQVPMIPLYDETEAKEKLRQFFTGSGYFEIISNSLVNKHLPGLESAAINLLNPQSSDMASLRTSLLTGMLTTMQKNIAVAERNLRLFEIGNVFRAKSDILGDFSDFDEEEVIGAAITGSAQSKEWFQAERQFDFFDMKGCIQSLLVHFGLTETIQLSYPKNTTSYLTDTITGSIENEVVLLGGKVDFNVLKTFGIEQEVYYFEVIIGKLKAKLFSKPVFKELLKFPKMVRDCAFVVDKQKQVDEITNYMKQQSSGILQSVRIFDIFEGEQVGAQKKSVAFTLDYYDYGRTLTDEEVEKDFSLLIKKVEKTFNAILRG